MLQCYIHKKQIYEEKILKNNEMVFVSINIKRTLTSTTTVKTFG